MQAKIILFFLAGIFTGCARGQAGYSPELVGGHRSVTYMHQAAFPVGDRGRLSNMVLVDKDYGKDKNNIFFVRTAFSLHLLPEVAVHIMAGLKNPGSFATILSQYKLSRPRYALSYAIGATYQGGLTLEQSLFAECSPVLSTKRSGYISASATANITSKKYQRGIQFIRLGIKEKTIIYGVALNFDQFDNGAKTLENAGIFIRHQF